MSETKKEAKKDAFDLLIQDHEKVKDLYTKWNSATTNRNKKKICSEIIKEVTIHSFIEEKVLYPLFPQAKLGDSQNSHFYQDRHALDHQCVKEMMHFLETQEPETDQEWNLFNETVKKCMTALLEHIQVEEKDSFPQLRKAFPDSSKIYDDLLTAKKSAPEHPDPSEGSGGTGSKGTESVKKKRKNEESV